MKHRVQNARLVLAWPTGDRAVCNYHAQQLLGIAAIAGFHVLRWPAPRFMKCANCMNENKKYFIATPHKEEEAHHARKNGQT